MATEASISLDGIADPVLVDRVHEALDQLFENAPGAGEEDRMLFRLAVSEVATNVVEHASQREPIHVTVRLGADDRGFSAVFTDDADPALIDLSAVTMPGEEAESGRGLAIALATLDQLLHETDGGNTWRLHRIHRGD
ncbi:MULTISPECIES: ATP-binding protein [Microbacterium]|uniref:ATP-binding protein n=1 Tax=Microbacterium TaxID=33882 RepID=UPI00146BFA76|nr:MULTISPECIES: ATP-binding protein [Microbacterium]